MSETDFKKIYIWDIAATSPEKVTSSVVENTVKYLAVMYVINNTSTIFAKTMPLLFEI